MLCVSEMQITRTLLLASEISGMGLVVQVQSSLAIDCGRPCVWGFGGDMKGLLITAVPGDDLDIFIYEDGCIARANFTMRVAGEVSNSFYILGGRIRNEGGSMLEGGCWCLRPVQYCDTTP